MAKKPLTVERLIKRLQKYRPDTIVSVDGYEDGLTDEIKIRKAKVAVGRRDGTPYYFGEHVEIDDVLRKKKPTDQVEARILIGRNN